MREPKNQMLGTMEPPLMQLSVKEETRSAILTQITIFFLLFTPIPVCLYAAVHTLEALGRLMKGLMTILTQNTMIFFFSHWSAVQTCGME